MKKVEHLAAKEPHIVLRSCWKAKRGVNIGPTFIMGTKTQLKISANVAQSLLDVLERTKVNHELIGSVPYKRKPNTKSH